MQMAIKIPLPPKPFKVAERYIQLQAKCAPASWMETARMVGDMILVPIILLFFVAMGIADPLTVAMNGMKAYQAWEEYVEYTRLRFEVQAMLLQCKSVGGPFIVTNDPKYMPYVLADAVYRTST